MTEKEYYSIREVADMLEIKPYVLRYWEKEFAILKPKRNRVGRRYYSRKDIDMIRSIKKILYDKGYTIAGAKKKLATVTDGPEQLSLPIQNSVKILKEIRDELTLVREMLGK